MSIFVPEILPDFVNPAKHAHDKPLKVQFSGDTEVKIHPQGVVEGDEGPCVRPSGKRTEYRRLDFQRAVVFQDLPECLDDKGPLTEGIPHFRVRDEIHVPLPVPDLGVLRPCNFSGSGRGLRRS